MTLRLRVLFDDSAYRLSHGSSPRGAGSWAFASSRGAAIEQLVWAPSGLTFTQAKAWVRQQITQPGSRVYEVMRGAVAFVPSAARGVVHVVAWVMP